MDPAVTRSGFRCADADRMAALRDRYARDHLVHLPRFLDAGLLDLVRLGLDRGSFVDFTHDGIGTEQVLDAGPCAGLLDLLFNDAALFEFMRALTGCPPIGCFQGRVYRFVPGAGHHDSWHSDMGLGRLVALSLNLGPPFEGGHLQLRMHDETDLVSEIANVGPGDAVVFRLADWLAHRVTPVTGTVSRTAYAGWFRSYPDVVSIWRDRFATHLAGPDAAQPPVVG
jgi:hypothetical protein